MGLLALICARASVPARGALEQDLYATTGGLEPHQSCRQPRGRRPDQVARPQITRQIPHLAVRERAGSPVKHQHPARRAFTQRFLGDQFGGQIVGKVLAAHARMLHAHPTRPGSSKLS